MSRTIYCLDIELSPVTSSNSFQASTRRIDNFTTRAHPLLQQVYTGVIIDNDHLLVRSVRRRRTHA